MGRSRRKEEKLKMNRVKRIMIASIIYNDK